jgi:ureidoacrylate peracid hydrolase
MHKATIYPSVIERVGQRRGGLPVFNRLDSKRTAHVVVDLQNGFMAAGAVAEIPEAREIVPAVNRISAAVRSAGGVVVYIQNTFDQVAVETWSVFFNHFCSPARRQRMIEAFTPGAEGHALWSGLDVRPEDLKVRKRRFGAFRPARAAAAAWCGYVDHYRHRIPGVLRINRARRDDAELQGILRRRRQRDVHR